MEIPQQLAIESFSYSWLSDKNHNSSSSSSSSSSTFHNPNNLKEHKSSYNFDFGIPLSTSPAPNLSHADEIFSDGHIKPAVFLHHRSSLPSKEIAGFRRVSVSLPSSPVPYYASEINYDYAAEKWRRPSAGYKRIFQKCFRFVKSFGFTRNSGRVISDDGHEGKAMEARSFHPSPGVNNSKKTYMDYGLKKMKSWGSYSSPQASPRISPCHYYSCNNKSWSDVDQSSIHEAILYCKRSIEK